MGRSSAASRGPDPAGLSAVGLPLFMVVFVVIPGAAVFGNWAIFHAFGNGRYLPTDSTGSALLNWWDGWGRPLVVGLSCWLLLMLRRVPPGPRTLLALGSVVASFVWLYAALFLVLALHPNMLD